MVCRPLGLRCGCRQQVEHAAAQLARIDGVWPWQVQREAAGQEAAFSLERAPPPAAASSAAQASASGRLAASSAVQGRGTAREEARGGGEKGGDWYAIAQVGGRPNLLQAALLRCWQTLLASCLLGVLIVLRDGWHDMAMAGASGKRSCTRARARAGGSARARVGADARA